MARLRRAVWTMRLVLGCVLGLFAGSCTAPDPPPDPSSQYQSASRHLRSGDFAAADRAIGDALRRTDPASPQRIDLQLLLADLRIRQNRAGEALEILNAIDRNAIEKASVRALVLALTGSTRLRSGRAAEALPLLSEAAALAGAGPSELTSRIDSLLGQYWTGTGDFSRAEAHYRKAAAAAATIGDGFLQSAALTNLGLLLATGSRRYDEAVQVLGQAVEAAEASGALLNEAIALVNLVIGFYRIGDTDSAIQLGERAIALQEKLQLPALTINALGETGNAYVLRNEPLKAVSYYERALQAARTAGDSNAASLWSGNSSAAYIRAGAWDKAEASNRESLRIRQELNRPALLINNTLYSGEIARGRGDFARAAELFRQVEREAAPDDPARLDAVSGLALTLHEQGEFDEANAAFERAVRMLEAGQSRLTPAEFRIRYLHGEIGRYRAWVDSLVEQGRTDEALRVAESSRARVLSREMSSPSAMRVSELQRSLPASSSVLVYWLGDRASYLWLIQQGRIEFRRLPGADELTADLRAHSSMIEGSRDLLDADDPPGRRLYRLLVAPVAQWIPRSGRVIVVPDGDLFSLNFESLIVEESGRRRFWIEDVSVAVAPSLGVLMAEPRRGARSGIRKVLAVGNAPPSPDGAFEPLEFAGDEIRSVAAQLPSAAMTVWQSAEATPDRYTHADLTGFDVIHFAAHAAANLESPLDSAVVLASNSTADPTYKLYARQVRESPLTARLVTISACRGAGARTYAGEGLVGFAWAFLQAGAGSVVAGLWDVGDRSTLELMGAMYERISAGDSPDAALRQAKLRMIGSRGPYRRAWYWAPFQVFVRGT